MLCRGVRNPPGGADGTRWMRWDVSPDDVLVFGIIDVVKCVMLLSVVSSVVPCRCC